MQEPWITTTINPAAGEVKQRPANSMECFVCIQKLGRGASFVILLQQWGQGLAIVHVYCCRGKTWHTVTRASPAEPCCRNRLNLLSSFQKFQTLRIWDLTHVYNVSPKRKWVSHSYFTEQRVADIRSALAQHKLTFRKWRRFFVHSGSAAKLLSDQT